MKKLTLLFAFLCASVMGWAIDWSDTSTNPFVPGSEVYQISGFTGSSVVNVQTSWGHEGIYVTFPIGLSSCSLGESGCHIEGAGLLMYLTALTAEETEVTVVDGNSTNYVFTVHNNAVGGGGDSFDPADIDWENIDFVSESNQFKIYFTEANRPANYTTINVQTAPWANNNTGIYITTPDGISDCSLGDKVGCWVEGAQVLMYLTAFIDEVTEVTITHASGTKTLYVYNANANAGGGGGDPGEDPEPEPAGINWSEISWIGGSTPADKYKIAEHSCVNIQQGGTATEPGIYINDFAAPITDCSLGDGHYAVQGGGIWLYTSAFKMQETEVTVTSNGNTYTFYVYYADGEPADLTGWDIARGKTSVAGHNSDGGHAAANDNNVNSRWSSNGAQHYASVGAAAEDWWYVDLGGFYTVNTIKILFETACPTDYDILISNNGASWTVIGTYTETPKTGNNPETDYNEYNFTNKVGRYVKIFARNGYNNFAYGFSMYEFEVYGERATLDDHNPPTITSAVLSGDAEWNQVHMTVAGTDTEDGAVVSFHVIDATNGIDQRCIADAGIITVTDLSGETAYNLTVKAVDAAGNESADGIVVNVTTPTDPTLPQVAAPTPSAAGKDILPIYSDAFASILAHPFDKDGWAGVPLMQEKNISGDNCLIYNVASANEVLWGMYDNGTSAIIAADGYHSATGMGVDASAMTHLHIDMWSLQVCTNAINIYINDAGLKTLRLSHDGEGWNSYDIALDEFAEGEEGKRIDNVRWMKFNGIGPISGRMALDNVYFWAPASNTKTVSASVSPASTGSVLITTGNPAVEVTEPVESGTSVTFTATPAEGYDFVNWTLGGVEVSTNPEYAMEITANTALVANFELHRDVYCRTVVKTNDNKTLYLSCSKVADNTYQIRVDGSAEARINGRNNFNFVINNTTDYSNEPYSNETGHGWLVSNEGYGYIVNTFSANDYKTLSFGSHYFAIGAQGGGEFILDNNFPAANTIAWNSTCADETAPVMAAPTAAALNTTDVRLTLSATDNWEGIITYNINYKPTGAEGDGTNVETTGASGATITYDIEGLTTNTGYTFTVTAKDAANNVCAAQSCTATPAGDVAAPTNVSITAVALTNTIVRLTLSADDDYAGDLTYNITYDNAGAASTSAAQGTSTTLDITGLTANTEYHFSVTATDAANNTSAAVNAPAVRTYAANLALNQPCEAGHETDNAGEAKGKSNDGDKASRWSSHGSVNKGTLATEDWWAVQLDNVYAIDRIRLSWQDARSDNMNVYVSMDGENWTLVQNFDFMPASSANGEAYTNYELGGAQGRYIKVLSLHDYYNGQWGISFWELEAYGSLATDVTAPVISEFTATGASTTSVVLKATATDNFNGDLTYTFYCNDAALANPVVKASGVEATYVVNELTMGTNYNFKVNVSDGVNSTMSDVVVGSPISDAQAPADVTVTSVATHNSITLTLSATDNLGGMIYYTITCGETVKEAQAVSGESVEVTFDGLDYSTPYAFSIVAKDGSNNEAEPVAHNKTTLRLPYPISAAPAPAFSEASVRPVYSSAYNKDCNFPYWGGSAMDRETYGVKKADADKDFLGIDGFGTIKVDADDELYLSVWTNEDISFRVVPIIHNAEESANLPERGAYTQTLTGGQWNVIHFIMSDFVISTINGENIGSYENYDRIYQIKIDRAGNQTFWLDNIYFRRKGALSDEGSNADFITANNNEGQDIVLERTFANDGYWYTLCLPFNLSNEQLTEVFGAGYTLATMSGSEDRGSLIHLNFDYVHELVAGKPYLFMPGQDVNSNPVFSGVTIQNVNPSATPQKVESTYMNFEGIFNAQTLTDSNVRFIGDNNYLYSPYSGGGTEMGAFRCYFTIPANAPAGAPGKAAKIVFAEEISTGISNVQGDYVQCTKVLKNGQLLIMREGRTYNAQGVLIQ